MLRVVDYRKIIVKIKGRWRYIYKPIYEDNGKGAGLTKSKDPSIFLIRGEIVKI